MADDLTDATGALWEQAKSEIRQQIMDLDTLRTRSVAMLSIAALVGGLFGSRLPQSHHSAVRVFALSVALLLFSLGVVLAVVISWPRKDWHVGVDIEPLTGMVTEGTVTLADVQLSLAYRANQSWSVNDAKLQSLNSLFGWLCVLVGLQVVAWTITIF